MPNQANFPDPLNGSLFQRPERVALKDLNLIKNHNHQILFGTSNKDNVEIWIYNADGSFAGHENVGPLDNALTLTTLIDNTGPYEVINIDMKNIANRLDVPPGRYAMVANFFRDEVGSENGYKLYISQISDDRTELALTPVDLTTGSLKDIYEWVTPSVPKEFAAPLIEQMFGIDIASGSEFPNFNPDTTHQITADKVLADMNKYYPNTQARLDYSDTHGLFNQNIEDIKKRAIIATLNLMAQDVFNYNVQKIEILNYINTAIINVLQLLVLQNQFDPRFLIK